MGINPRTDVGAVKLTENAIASPEVSRAGRERNPSVPGLLVTLDASGLTLRAGHFLSSRFVGKLSCPNESMSVRNTERCIPMVLIGGTVSKITACLVAVVSLLHCNVTCDCKLLQCCLWCRWIAGLWVFLQPHP